MNSRIFANPSKKTLQEDHMSLSSLPGQSGFYKGKVRDVFYIGAEWLVMVASDRISAFDVILPRPIPFKGQILNQIAAHMLHATAEICPNWLSDVPAPNVSVGRKCEPFRIEMVVRGNMVGHAWRTYNAGLRSLCGAKMPDGMKENDFFPEPILTPSTKAEAGHDEDITPDEIITRGLATRAQWDELADLTLRLFKKGCELANARQLILADTKYEFGLLDGHICLMDEIHTPDSSRYFLAEGFEERQARGERQLQLSKEFVREWLISEGFMGKEGQVVPVMTDEWIETISGRYRELYERVIGAPFNPETLTDEETRQRVVQSLERLGAIG
jgi:phosphoribosylaminoimidazole-succinocarboxamide synthase